MKKYLVMYRNGTEEVMDSEEVGNLIYDELEMFTRDDVNMIDEIDEDGNYVRTVWTEEEGIITEL